MANWTSTGGTFEKPPAGTFIARCIRVIELGTQHGEYQGKPSVKRKTMVVWELPTETMTDGRPFSVSKFYTASLNEMANLRHDLESWRGKKFTEEELGGFDPRNILDKPCLITLVEDGERVKAQSIVSLPKGMAVPPRVNPLYFYDVDDHDNCAEAWDALSDRMKDMIRASDEWKAREQESKGVLNQLAATASASAAPPMDEIPF